MKERKKERGGGGNKLRRRENPFCIGLETGGPSSGSHWIALLLSVVPCLYIQIERAPLFFFWFSSISLPLSLSSSAVAAGVVVAVMWLLLLPWRLPLRQSRRCCRSGCRWPVSFCSYISYTSHKHESIPNRHPAAGFITINQAQIQPRIAAESHRIAELFSSFHCWNRVLPTSHPVSHRI